MMSPSKSAAAEGPLTASAEPLTSARRLRSGISRPESPACATASLAIFIFAGGGGAGGGGGGLRRCRVSTSVSRLRRTKSMVGNASRCSRCAWPMRITEYRRPKRSNENSSAAPTADRVGAAFDAAMARAFMVSTRGGQRGDRHFRDAAGAHRVHHLREYVGLGLLVGDDDHGVLGTLHVQPFDQRPHFTDVDAP